jgi:predicted component of type VI protein secretion system
MSVLCCKLDLIEWKGDWMKLHLVQESRQETSHSHLDQTWLMGNTYTCQGGAYLRLFEIQINNALDVVKIGARWFVFAR